jgi:hypothetical protein
MTMLQPPGNSRDPEERRLLKVVPFGIDRHPGLPELHSLDPALDLDTFRREAVAVPQRDASAAAAAAGSVRWHRWGVAGLIVLFAAIVLAWWRMSFSVAAAPGPVRIESQPQGALVTIDGVDRGATPLELALPWGTHAVKLSSPLDGGEDGFDIQVTETPQMHRVQLAAVTGSTNATVGRVAPDLAPVTPAAANQPAAPPHPIRATVPPPARFGMLDINARPWARVAIDGLAIGETPIGEVRLTEGAHVITLTHPEFGERRHRALVRPGETTRVAIDMRAPESDRQ